VILTQVFKRVMILADVSKLIDIYALFVRWLTTSLLVCHSKGDWSVTIVSFVLAGGDKIVEF
jgi:hypothetical protein